MIEYRWAVAATGTAHVMTSYQVGAFGTDAWVYDSMCGFMRNFESSNRPVIHICMRCEEAVKRYNPTITGPKPEIQQ